MKHEINMKPGFAVKSNFSDDKFDYIECINFELWNEVINQPYTNESNPNIRHWTTVGVWQPKGTKLKRDAEKL